MLCVELLSDEIGALCYSLHDHQGSPAVACVRLKLACFCSRLRLRREALATNLVRSLIEYLVGHTQRLLRGLP